MARVEKYATLSVAALIGACAALVSHAADIAVTGLFNGKAVVVVNGGKPRTLNVGETSPEGVKLLGASSEAALVEFGGERRTLAMGSGTRLAASAPSSGRAQAVLKADNRGHFFAEGWINGSGVRFMVDTGATSIALSRAQAQRLGVNYLSGVRASAETANGQIAVYVVKLDTVRIGDITLNNVEAIVSEGTGPPIALLGMSFLNRTQMKRDGDTLTLIKRF